MSSSDSLFGTNDPTTVQGDLNVVVNVTNHSWVDGSVDASPIVAKPEEPRRANATLVMLARNSDLEGVVQSVRSMEDRFNRKYKYPWVILNEEPFTADFIQFVVLEILSHIQI